MCMLYLRLLYSPSFLHMYLQYPSFPPVMYRYIFVGWSRRQGFKEVQVGQNEDHTIILQSKLGRENRINLCPTMSLCNDHFQSPHVHVCTCICTYMYVLVQNILPIYPVTKCPASKSKWESMVPIEAFLFFTLS